MVSRSRSRSRSRTPRRTSYRERSGSPTRSRRSASRTPRRARSASPYRESPRAPASPPPVSQARVASPRQQPRSPRGYSPDYVSQPSPRQWSGRHPSYDSQGQYVSQPPPQSSFVRDNQAPRGPYAQGVPGSRVVRQPQPATLATHASGRFTPSTASRLQKVNHQPTGSRRRPFNLWAAIGVCFAFLALIFVIIAISTYSWTYAQNASPIGGEWKYGLLGVKDGNSGQTFKYSEDKSQVTWRAGTAIFVILIFAIFQIVGACVCGTLDAIGGPENAILFAIGLALFSWLLTVISLGVWAGEVHAEIELAHSYEYGFDLMIAACVFLFIAAVLFIIALLQRPPVPPPKLPVYVPPPPPPVDLEEVRVANDMELRSMGPPRRARRPPPKAYYTDDESESYSYSDPPPRRFPEPMVYTQPQRTIIVRHPGPAPGPGAPYVMSQGPQPQYISRQPSPVHGQPQYVTRSVSPTRGPAPQFISGAPLNRHQSATNFTSVQAPPSQQDLQRHMSADAMPLYRQRQLNEQSARGGDVVRSSSPPRVGARGVYEGRSRIVGERDITSGGGHTENYDNSGYYASGGRF